MVQTGAQDQPVRRLGPRGRRARVAATVAVLGALGWGSAVGTDDMFPFGPMTQYSFRIDPDGEIRALWVEADLADGTHRRLDLSSSVDVGLNRAELEGQLHLFIADPARLQTLALAWARLHPDRPVLRRVILGQDVVELSDGRRDGRRSDVFATWDVR